MAWMGEEGRKHHSHVIFILTHCRLHDSSSEQNSANKVQAKICKEACDGADHTTELGRLCGPETDS